jgi:hypothetical protein
MPHTGRTLGHDDGRIEGATKIALIPLVAVSAI